MSKKSRELLEKIIEEVGTIPIHSICKKNGVTFASFYKWLADPEFKDLKESYEKAKLRSNKEYITLLMDSTRFKLKKKLNEEFWPAIKYVLDVYKPLEDSLKQDYKIQLIEEINNDISKLDLDEVTKDKLYDLMYKIEKSNA